MTPRPKSVLTTLSVLAIAGLLDACTQADSNVVGLETTGTINPTASVPAGCAVADPAPPGKLDVLFITDTSNSMDQVERPIAIQSIFEFLPTALAAGIDINIGVLLAHSVASPNSGTLYQFSTEPTVLKSSALSVSEMLDGVFVKLAPNPDDPESDGGEEAFTSLLTLLQAGNMETARGEDFFRADAALIALFISDENELCAVFPAGVTPVIDPEGREAIARARDCADVTAEAVYSQLTQATSQRPLAIGAMIYDGSASVPSFGENEIGYGYIDLLSMAGQHGFSIDLNLSVGQMAEELERISSIVAGQPGEAPPVVTTITLPDDPVAVNTASAIEACFTDENPSDTHTATIDWETITTSASVSESGGAGTVSGSHTYGAPGVYTIGVTVSDGGKSGSRSSTLDVPAYIVVYDPSAGFVTGGGWIDSPAGACAWSGCASDGSTTGKATFGFVSRYKKGANVPDGSTEFQFKAGGLHFKSNSYEWLVIAGARAQFKGEGTINGAGSYGFLITAIDAAVPGGGDVDAFRMKIWDSATNAVVYDNKMGEGEDGDAATALGGGSVVIHKGK